MAVTVNFKTASKKVNSTAVVGGTVTAINCNINEPCTIKSTDHLEKWWECSRLELLHNSGFWGAILLDRGLAIYK